MKAVTALESYMFYDVLDPAYNVMTRRVKSANSWSSIDGLVEIQESFIQALLVTEIPLPLQSIAVRNVFECMAGPKSRQARTKGISSN